MAEDAKAEEANVSEWVMQRPRAIFYLNQANHAVRSRLDAALSLHQITSIQYSVLSVIGSRDRLSSAELSRRFFVAPQTMNELIGGLLRRNLITRSEDPDNRRILRMSLTAEGKRIMKACDAAADAAEEDIFSFLPQESYQQFRELCRMIARNLREREERARAE